MKRIFLVLGLIIFALTACRNNNSDEVDPVSLIGGAGIFAIPLDTEAEITIMTWAGSGTFRRDIGRVPIAPEDITGHEDAAMIATATAFNAYFPNITVNSYCVPGGDFYAQARENMRLEHGVYPDAFWVGNLSRDIVMGMIADLTIFEDDPMYQSINPAILDMVKIGGRTWALPTYFTPNGIYVNRSLPERENMDVPPINWTLNQYMQFVSNHKVDEYYGAWEQLWPITESGTQDFFMQLARHADRQPGESYIKPNTQPMRNVLAQIIPLFEHNICSNEYLGKLSPEFMEQIQWSGLRAFAQNKLLTYHGGQYSVRDVAHPDGANHSLGNIVEDWDIYPRPSTEYIGNHIGVTIDPFAIRNYAMDDGDPNLSLEEFDKMAIAFDFVKFYVGDTQAWRARANQQYNTEGTLSHALTDAFPVVTGQAYNDQMDIWFTSGREMLRDANSFPGFHYIMDLVLQGEFAAISNKTIPWHYEVDGNTQSILTEWYNKWNPEYVGVFELDPSWLDELYARLPLWEELFNERWEAGFAELYEAMDRFYPVQQKFDNTEVSE